MRGFFAIGIDQVSKPGNIGNLVRTAHGFGAAFVFTLRSGLDDGSGGMVAGASSDTARSARSVPLYDYAGLDEMVLPRGCKLVAVELAEDAVALPSFRHPLQAAYILGGERLGVSREVLARADHVIRIPSRFSLNVATAGAIVMYDRLLTLGGFARRPVSSIGAPEPRAPHVHGGPRQSRKTAKISPQETR